jgi:hypothetical protein
MKCCITEGGVVLYNCCVYMCSVSSLWGSELGWEWCGVGSMVPGMGWFGGCVIVGWGCLDKVGMRFSSVKMIGQALCGGV